MAETGSLISGGDMPKGDGEKKGGAQCSGAFPAKCPSLPLRPQDLFRGAGFCSPALRFFSRRGCGSQRQRVCGEESKGGWARLRALSSLFPLPLLRVFIRSSALLVLNPGRAD